MKNDNIVLIKGKLVILPRLISLTASSTNFGRRFPQISHLILISVAICYTISSKIRV